MLLLLQLLFTIVILWVPAMKTQPKKKNLLRESPALLVAPLSSSSFILTISGISSNSATRSSISLSAFITTLFSSFSRSSLVVSLVDILAVDEDTDDTVLFEVTSANVVMIEELVTPGLVLVVVEVVDVVEVVVVVASS